MKCLAVAAAHGQEGPQKKKPTHKAKRKQLIKDRFSFEAMVYILTKKIKIIVGFILLQMQPRSAQIETTKTKTQKRR